jgi:hypothetical protein
MPVVVPGRWLMPLKHMEASGNRQVVPPSAVAHALCRSSASAPQQARAPDRFAREIVAFLNDRCGRP